jgi:phosphoribosylaminoimidazolecarboxamide formyltransferase/IMP cyclohydrolase
MANIKRALISVSDKKGVVEFAKGLSHYKVALLSTGGTAQSLRDSGLTVEDVSHYTGFPEMLDGRVKTLHPKIHGGLLGQRSKAEHVEKMEAHGIEPIDMVVVNLYPFEATVAQEGCSLEDAIENIDIGGPTMIRSAAKNYPDVTVIIDPEDYNAVLDEMERTGGEVSVETNFRLAKKVFQSTARYDGAISNYLGSLHDGKKDLFPETISLQYAKAQELRYGENPHQKGAFYKEGTLGEPCVAGAVQLQGKALSYNNILDTDAALETVKEFEETAVVIIKHTNPCGVATSATSLADAYRKAKSCDPVSAFGGIVALNRPVDEETAREISAIFTEVVIAPDYGAEALKILSAKKDLRLLRVPLTPGYSQQGFEMKRVVGGMLVQERDLGKITDMRQCEVVTKRKPTADEYEAMAFAWKVCKHVKSNAIVYTVKDRTIGVGAGQMSRIDSSRIAVDKAQFPLKGTVMASDAMFPFRDSVDAAAKAGATAIVQPGGSIRDKEVVQAANEADIAMIFTGMRHFRH